MQPQEINKIKELVKISSLLSQDEKAEWLALAEIMNDKQLWELKSILASNVEHGTLNQSVKASGTGQAWNIKQKPMGVPPLTHIMNLPKAGTAVFPHTPASNNIITPPAPSYLKRGEENKTGFWQKIKDILAEKELPAGHKELAEELQLAEHVETKPAPRPPSVQKETAKPLPFSAAKPEMLKTPPAPIKPVDQELTIGTLKVSNLVVAKRETGYPGPVEAAATFEDPFTRQAESVEKESIPKTADDDLFVPGLKDTGILLDAKLKKTKAPDSGQDADAGFAAAGRYGENFPKVQKHYEHIDIHTLEQVGELGVKALSKDILPPLKNLTGVLGYHKLALVLEKSPMFQSYINTGLAVLGGKYDLDSGEYRERTLEKYLTKEEFERFVDVLRAIKN